MRDESKTITREELYQMVWEKPTRDVAKEFGISDVGLGKICKKLNVPKPPPGYWQRIAHGYKVKIPALSQLRKGQLSQGEIWPSPRKSTSKTPNQVIVDLLEREKLIENRILVSPDLRGAHKLVSYTKKMLSRARPDAYGRLMLAWNTRVERPILNLSVSKQSLHRSLRIIDSLLNAMEQRGYAIVNDPGPKFLINDEKVAFYIREKVERSERELTSVEKERPWLVDRWIYTPNGVLIFTIDEFWADRKNWRDKKNKPLEDQLNEIVAGIISAAEIMRLKRLERDAERQRWREKELRRQEEELKAQREREMIEELETDCKLWLRSLRLRQFLRRCERSFAEAGRLYTGSEAERWLQWARAHAASLDPVKTGRLAQKVLDMAAT